MLEMVLLELEAVKRLTPVPLVIVLLAGPAPAQTNLETNAGVQFNFSTPGAGNLAMGGAFLGLAFDASTAYTNPAGLTTLLEPEATIEARGWQFTHVFTDRGRLDGVEPSGEGLDTISGLQEGSADNHVLGPSFLSYARPWKRGTFALFRHELVHFRAKFGTQGAFLLPVRSRNQSGIPGDNEGRLAALDNRMNLDLVTYGFAAAYRPTLRLSLGLGVSYYDFSMDAEARRFVPRRPFEDRFDEATVHVSTQFQRGNDDGWGLTGGFLWVSPARRWSVGGVYRQGPDFDLETENRPEPASPRPDFDMPDETIFRTSRFHVPDTYGVGVAFQATDRLRLAFDVDRVEYTDLLDDFIDIFGFDILFPGRDPELDRFVIDDVTELHLGAELGFYEVSQPFFLRAGVWHEPDHSIRFEGENVGFGAEFRGGGDELHYTFGAGILRTRLQLDFAVDWSERVKTLSLSTVFRLPERSP